MFKKFREVKWKLVAVPEWSRLTWNGKLSHLSCRGLPSSFGLSICLICFFIFSISFPTFFFRVSNIKLLLSMMTSPVTQCTVHFFSLLKGGIGGADALQWYSYAQWHMEMFRKKIIFKRPTWLHRRTSINPPSPFTNNSCCIQYL